MRRIIWNIYKRQILIGTILYLLGAAGLFCVSNQFDNSTFDIRSFISLCVNSDTIKSIPPFWGVLIYFLIPLIIPFIGLALIRYILFPYRITSVLKTLYDRCWEISELGRGWIGKELDNVLGKVDAFRQGIQVVPSEIEEICNSVYEITRVKKVFATCLPSISNIYSDTERKVYMEATLNKIKQINKFDFNRYVISAIGIDNIINNNPTEDIKWFVKLHYQNNDKKKKINLYYKDINSFVALCSQHGISLDKMDVLFFDGSIVLSLQTDPSSRQVIFLSPYNKNILFVIDLRETVKAYNRLLNSLHTSSIDIIDLIKKNSWENIYDI